MATKDELLSRALQLPPSERAELAGELLISLDQEPPEDPALVEREWTDEIRRRAAQVRAGDPVTVDGREVIARSREWLRKYGHDS